MKALEEIVSSFLFRCLPPVLSVREASAALSGWAPSEVFMPFIIKREGSALRYHTRHQGSPRHGVVLNLPIYYGEVSMKDLGRTQLRFEVAEPRPDTRVVHPRCL